MNVLVIATRNKNKVREIRELLNDLKIEILDLESFPHIPEIVEDSSTFEGNALKKARVVFEALKMPVLSDDSGLEVEALDFQPGVRSARFAGEPPDYEKNNTKLLYLLKNVTEEKRRAQFRCVIVFKTYESEKIVEGVCSGRIINQLKGTGGFGYDPLFVPDGYEQTFAEMPIELKNKISHRSQALQKIKPFLLKYFLNI